MFFPSIPALQGWEKICEGLKCLKHHYFSYSFWPKLIDWNIFNCFCLARESASLPLFVDRMVNQTVLEGMPVSFEAEARGFPAPMMSWQRDGRMLSTDNQYHIQTAGGRSSLHIAHAGPEDNAWFQCTAANVAGVATNRARLIVQGQSLSFVLWMNEWANEWINKWRNERMNEKCQDFNPLSSLQDQFVKIIIDI